MTQSFVFYLNFLNMSCRSECCKRQIVKTAKCILTYRYFFCNFPFGKNSGKISVLYKYSLDCIYLYPFDRIYSFDSYLFD